MYLKETGLFSFLSFSLLDAEIILASISSTDSMVGNNNEYNYSIHEVFNPSSKRGGKLNITQLGHWNNKDGFKISLKQTKIERRRNLNGIALSSVISLNNVPNHTTFLEHINSNKFTHLDSMNRMAYRLFLIMMDMYNFTMNLRVSDIWGSLDSEGRWHGAIGLLNRSEVDLAISAFRWTNVRYGAFEHTTHSYHVQ